jgi:hypothetical protein
MRSFSSFSAASSALVFLLGFLTVRVALVGDLLPDRVGGCRPDGVPVGVGSAESAIRLSEIESTDTELNCW